MRTAGTAETGDQAEAEFYQALTERNAGVTSQQVQTALRGATILVAGCGSIGGAAVEPLTRLGGKSFLLADPGEYELNNLNRQNATAADVGRNKARTAAERVLAINPYASVEVFPHGVTADCVSELTTRCDVVVDGVDVTTRSGLLAKYLLHEHACAARLPLLTGWDMAGAQYVRVYDYRRLSRPFAGRLTRGDLEQDMWHVLRRLVSPRYVPLEMVTLIRGNLGNPGFSFPQLVYAADLFAAMSSYLVTQLLVGAPVREHTYLDLHQVARPAAGRWRARVQRPVQVVSTLTELARADRRG